MPLLRHLKGQKMSIQPLKNHSNWLTIPTCCIACKRYVRHMPIAHTWRCTNNLVLPTKKQSCAKALKRTPRSAFYNFLKLHKMLGPYFVNIIKDFMLFKNFTTLSPEKYVSSGFLWPGKEIIQWKNLNDEWTALLKKEY